MTNPKHTDTSRSDDLVQRLRERIADTLLAGLPYNRDGDEAADRIEALEAENERLEERMGEAYQLAGQIADEYDGNGKIERLLDLLSGAEG